MRTRGIAAAAAGVVGAAAAHALDAAGLLPGVRESVAVRTAMGPLATVSWLGLAALLAWLAARTRPALVGAGSALLVSAVPELVGRHDVGAVTEPGALAGAVLQWLLLLAVVAIAVAVDRFPSVRVPALLLVAVTKARPRRASGPIARLIDRRGRPRAPPSHLLSVPVI